MTPQDLPFTEAEYRSRRARVCDKMARRGIDQLYVTSPVNLLYLTGYEAMWYPPRLPLGGVLSRDNERLVIFDWSRHAAYARARVLCDDVVLFEYGDAPEVVASWFTRQGRGGRVGVEWSSPTPSAPVMRDVADRLQAAGVDVVSGDWIIDNIRLYKSEAELVCVRRAAVMADRAMRRLWGELRPGMSELEISARMGWLLADEGSEPAAMPVLVNAGPDAWRDIHGFPSSRRVEAGEVVNIDCCASVHRYHANLGRSFVLGPSATRARALISLGAKSLDVLKDMAVLDADPAPAAQAALRYVQNLIPDRNLWWIGGYALGLSLPPNWVGHTYLANDGVETCRLRAGYVSNFENVYVDADEGFEAGCIDTLIMTPQGLELLSALPRELLDVVI